MNNEIYIINEPGSFILIKDKDGKTIGHEKNLNDEAMAAREKINKPEPTITKDLEGAEEK